MMEWKDEFSVNIVQIDTQHKKLVQLINDLFTAAQEKKTKEKITEILNNMMAYVMNHFSTEEFLMTKHGYPDLPHHQQEHNLFKQKANEFVTRVKEGKLLLTLEVSNFLKDWLTKHIMGTDKKYAPFLQSKGIK